MPLLYLTGTSVVTTNDTSAVAANTEDKIIIALNAVRGATGGGSSYGIDATVGATGIDILVMGTVFGDRGAIEMAGVVGTNSIAVDEEGYVFAGEGNAIFIEGARAILENRGTIETLDSGGDGSSSFTVASAADRTTIYNSGEIIHRASGAVISSSGDLGTSLVNTGTIMSIRTIPSEPNSVGSIHFNSSALTARDLVWNTGTIIGTINLGGGNDLYQGGGQVIGTIGMASASQSAGDDTLVGGDHVDVIVDSVGSNWLIGGGNADTIFIGNAANEGQVDHVFGGVAGGVDNSLSDTLAFTTEANGGGVNVLMGSGVVTSLVNNGVVAVMTGIENVIGTGFADAIIGNDAGNRIEGGDGQDWQVGNGGADTFVFSDALDADADQIRDLRRSEGDRIDLSGIDAIPGTGDQNFSFSTTRTPGLAGQLVVTNFGIGARVDLFLNTDNTVDGFFFVVYGESGMGTLQQSDFLL